MNKSHEALRRGMWFVFSCAGLLLLPNQAVAAQDTNLFLSAVPSTNGQLQLTLNGQANVSYVIEKSVDLQNWNSLLTNTTSGVSRIIVIDGSDGQSFYRALRKPLSAFALCARENIDLTGNAIIIDSFNSADPTFSTLGHYDSAKAKDDAVVANNSGIPGSFSLGNAKIKGWIRTVPDGTVTLGPVTSIGDSAWVNESNVGVQPGHFSDDMAISFPNVVTPFTVALIPPSAVIGGTNYTYALSGGDYSLSTLNLGSSGKLYVTNNNRLHVNGNVTMSGTAYVYIAPGATLELYVGGSNSGFTSIHNIGNATSFRYYGLTNNLSVTFTAGFSGIIYAPNADVFFNAGGAAHLDFAGSCLGRNITLSSRVRIHFDEILINGDP